MSRPLPLLLCCAAALAACSNVEAANGTALFVTVTAPPGTAGDELVFFGKREDGTAVFGPVRRSPGGALAFPQTVRVLLKNGAYGGAVVRVKVDASAQGQSVAFGESEVTVREGLETPIEVVLRQACVGQPGCTTCTGDEDCVGPGARHCHPDLGACVECTQDAHCGAKVCDPATSHCVTCTQARGCAPPAPACDLAVEGGVCVGCLSRADCAGSTPICDPQAKTCVACKDGAYPCASGEVCATTGQCIRVPDTCADAQPLVLTGNKVTLAVAPNLGKNQYQATCTNVNGSDVVYELNLPTRRDVSILLKRTTGSAGQPIVYLRKPCEAAVDYACSANVFELSGNGMTLYDVPEGKYAIVVEHSTADEAIYDMTVTLGGPTPKAPNDECASAQLLSFTADVKGTLTATVDGDTTGATNSDSGPGCSPGMSKDVVYQVDLKEPRDLLVTVDREPSLPAYAPVVSLRPFGSCADPSRELSCENPGLLLQPTRLIACNLPAGSYALFVDGGLGTYGKFKLAVTAFGPTPKPADVCGGSATLAPGEGACGTTAGTPGNPFSNDYNANFYKGTCGGTAWDGPDVAYELKAGVGRHRVTVVPSTRFDPTAAHAVNTCGDSSCQASVNQGGLGQPELLDFTPNLLFSNYVVVDGVNSAARGSFILLYEKL